MVDTIVSELGNTDDLIKSVHKELLALRAAHGRLTVEKFSQFPSLILVFGGGDLLEAFLGFEREMRRYVADGNRDVAAAAISLTAAFDTVPARFEEVLGHFEDFSGQERNQRTARRWSDRGFKTIATEMVHVAEVRGRLGSELLTIELSGTRSSLQLVIWQLTNKHLDERAPLVRFWRHVGDDLVEQSNDLTLDFDKNKDGEATNDGYKLKRHRIVLELPEVITVGEDVDPGDALYSISIEGRDAPMRTVTFDDKSELGDGIRLRFTTYRTIATVEIVKQ